MRVSELASQLNITPDTVRYYTRVGFLSPERNRLNGYKEYSKGDRQRLYCILSARKLGFSVNDIGNILLEAEKGMTACPLVRGLMTQRLEETEQQFQKTLALRTRMQKDINDWETKPNKEPTGYMICHLIEEFGGTDFGSKKLGDIKPASTAIESAATDSSEALGTADRER